MSEHHRYRKQKGVIKIRGKLNARAVEGRDQGSGFRSAEFEKHLHGTGSWEHQLLQGTAQVKVETQSRLGKPWAWVKFFTEVADPERVGVDSGRAALRAEGSDVLLGASSYGNTITLSDVCGVLRRPGATGINDTS